MDGQVPKAVVQERYERLVALQEEISWAENKRAGRHPPSSCWSRRARAARTPPPAASPAAPATAGSCTSPRATAIRPGDLVATAGDPYAAPHHLVADGAW